MIPARYMQRCLDLAQLGRSTAAPNPMVGAVLVYQNRIIGEGWHKAAGQPHAEVNCFNSVRDEDRHLIPESTLFVNLEPCAHMGRTPACAPRIVREGVKQVYIAHHDPHRMVGGAGVQILKDNGVKVFTGLMEQEARWLNRRFLCHVEQKRPYIILKWAQTLTGLFAPLNRTRFQISNQHSHLLLHKWRAEESAIMIGYGTALSDDPQLTARRWEGPQPLRVVLDQRLHLPDHLRVFQSDAPTWIVNETKEDQKGHLRWVRLPFNERLLPGLLERLHEKGHISLIVEGGAQLLQSFINLRLFDEIRMFQADAALSEGIPAPHFDQAHLIAETELGNDRLMVFANALTLWPYADGMSI